MSTANANQMEKVENAISRLAANYRTTFENTLSHLSQGLMKTIFDSSNAILQATKDIIADSAENNKQNIRVLGDQVLNITKRIEFGLDNLFHLPFNGLYN